MVDAPSREKYKWQATKAPSSPIILDVEDDAYSLRRDSARWREVTKRSGNEHVTVFIKETGKFVDLPGPNCCIFCGEVWRLTGTSR